MWVSECGYLPEKRVALVLGWNNVVGRLSWDFRQKAEAAEGAPGTR